MSEILMNPEMQEMMPQAISKVRVLCAGDQQAILLQTQSPEQRDQFWRKKAQELGPFSEKITELRQVLKDANTTKGKYLKSTIKLVESHFSNVDDPVAKLLLADLLLARSTSSPGHIDYSRDIIVEAQAMASELGKNGQLLEEGMESVSLDKVIKSVLDGSLKLNRQTPLNSKAK